MNCTSRSAFTSVQSANAPGNVNLSALRKTTAGIAGKSVYGYIIRSVSMHDGTFRQEGCGPNWQGGLITLCTCKHLMRSYHDHMTWPGHWIAGFTGFKATPELNVLVYLMQVGQAHESYMDLWIALPSEARSAKAARLSTVGDVYEPIMERMLDPESRFVPENYKPPRPDHVHAKDSAWHRDIDYVYKGKRQSYLVGDPQVSFIWKKPTIELSDLRLHRGCKQWSSMQAFLSDLVDCRGTAHRV